ncbi:MAG: SRPBCC domain-containing protein [Geminicoccaceae bacterium]
MNRSEPEDPNGSLVLEYELEDPPHKVWRAISIPQLREQWLPNEALADPEAHSVTAGEEVRYRVRDSDPPHLESVVTLRIAPNVTGGTVLRVIHELTDARRVGTRMAANDNGPSLMRAA